MNSAASARLGRPTCTSFCPALRSIGWTSAANRSGARFARSIFERLAARHQRRVRAAQGPPRASGEGMIGRPDPKRSFPERRDVRRDSVLDRATVGSPLSVRGIETVSPAFSAVPRRALNPMHSRRASIAPPRVRLPQFESVTRK